MNYMYSTDRELERAGFQIGIALAFSIGIAPDATYGLVVDDVRILKKVRIVLFRGEGINFPWQYTTDAVHYQWLLCMLCQVV